MTAVKACRTPNHPSLGETTPTRSPDRAQTESDGIARRCYFQCGSFTPVGTNGVGGSSRFISTQ
jgi:hypothetical protein